MGVKLYYTSVTASRAVKSQQEYAKDILGNKKIEYELIDISEKAELRDQMRSKSENPKALPPQFFNGDQYCGDYEQFFEAVETDTVRQFLKLA